MCQARYAFEMDDQVNRRGPSRSTVEAVVSAGFDLLMNEGLTSLTPHRIHQRSGVARTTVYRHWPSPESVLESIIDETTTTISPAPSSGNLADDLERELTDLWVRFQERPIRALIGSLLVADSSLDESEHHRTRHRRLLDQLASPIIGTIRLGQESHQLNPGHSGVLADELIGPFFYRYVGLALPPDTWFTQWVVTAFLARHSASRDPSSPSEWNTDE